VAGTRTLVEPPAAGVVPGAAPPLGELVVAPDTEAPPLPVLVGLEAVVEAVVEVVLRVLVEVLEEAWGAAVRDEPAVGADAVDGLDERDEPDPPHPAIASARAPPTPNALNRLIFRA
jgi:hypothetical protein